MLITACQPKVAEVTSPYGKLEVSGTVDFGFISTRMDSLKLITLKNVGGRALTSLEASISDDAVFKFTGGDYPGLLGTCQNGISPGESCIIEIQMKNTSSGDWSSRLQIEYNDSIDKIQTAVNLVGRTGTIADLKSPANSYSIETDEPNREKFITINIANEGVLPATSLNVSIAGNNKFSLVSTNCGNSLAGSLSCNVNIKYKSSELGAFQGALTASYDNGETGRSLTISLSAITASIEANFVDVPYLDDELPFYLNGQTFSKKFKIKNAGYLPGTINSVSFDDLSGSTVVQTCGGVTNTVPVDSVCEVDVEFTPPTHGTFTRKLLVQYNSGKATRTYEIEFKVTVGRQAEVAFYAGFQVSNYDFGRTGIGETKRTTFLVKNEGDVSLQSSSFFEGISPPYSIGTTTCSNPLYILPGGTCVLEIIFSPTVSQVDNKSIILNYSNGFSPVTKSLGLTGTGVPVGILTKLSPLSMQFDFGTHRAGSPSQVKQLILKNTGLMPLHFQNFFFDTTVFSYEGGSFPGTSGGCNMTLAVNEVCTISLVSLGNTSGDFSSSLYIRFDNTDRIIENLFVTFKASVKQPGTLSIENPISRKVMPTTASAPLYDEVAGFYSKNLDQTINIVLRNYGSLNISFSNLTLTYISGGSNPFTAIDTSNCLGGIVAGGSCNLSATLNSSVNSTYKIAINATFNNGYENVTIPEHRLGFIVSNLAALKLDSKTANFATVAGTAVSKTILVENIGSGSATNITISRSSFPASQFSMTHNCPNPLPAGQNCNLTIVFNPPSNTLWDDAIALNYDNGGIALNPVDPSGIDFHLKSLGIDIVAQSFSAANLSVAGGANSFDFDKKEMSTTNLKSFTIRNTGGMVATILSCTGLTVPMTNSCLTTIPGNSSATINVNFNPTSAHIGQSYNQNLTIQYNNGAAAKTLVLNIKGKVIAPKSTHKGWRDVFATGSTSLGGNASVSFKWAAMTVPNPIVINKYLVFRKIGSNVFDLAVDTPIGTITNLANLSFTDTAVTDGTVYYYYVVPYVYTSNPSEPTLTSYSTLRVVVPPKDMTLVHRMTANQIMCEKGLSKTPSFSNWNRCAYTGPGAIDGAYDIQHDLLVDKYETNTSDSNAPNQIPRTNMGQQAAWDLCQTKTQTLNGITGSLQKRLMTRKEYFISSFWNPSLGHPAITATEHGIASDENCNNLGSVEITGNNLSCVSVFGLMDAVGNAWEWTADRLINGVPVPPSGRLVDINDYPDINYATIEASESVTSFKCLAPALGMPVPKTPDGTCATGLVDIQATPAANFHGDYFYSPTGNAQGLLFGGSSSSDANTNAGIYTSAWISPLYGAGARCALQMTY